MNRALARFRVLPAAVALAVSIHVAHAQRPIGNDMQAGHGAFQIGYMKLNLTDFNAALAANGYPRMDDHFLTLGGTGFGEPGRWMIGGEGQAFIAPTRTTTTGSYQVSLGGGYGMFRVGYDFAQTENVDLFPSIGIGGGGVAFNIRGRSAPTFADVLATPGRSSNMTQGGFMLGAGLTANYRVRLPMKDTTRTGGLLFGVSGGYIINPFNSDWRLDGVNTVAGGPSISLQGWYARFSIGGWGRGPKRRR